MTIYTGALIWVLIIGIVTRKIYIENSDNQIRLQYTYMEAFLMMSYLIFFTGLRSAGADTGAYIQGYEKLPTGFSELIASLQEEEGLFRALGIAVKTYISEDYQPYLFLIALFSGLAVVFALKNGTPYLTSAMILYVLQGYWVWMFNGIRQFLAVAIAFMATVYLTKKETRNGFIIYAILIIITSGIHTSVLILIPTYFLVRGEALSKKTCLTLIVAVFAIFFTAQFTSFLGTALEETTYGNIIDGTYYSNDTGSNPIRTVIYAVPLALAYFDRRNIWRNASSIVQISVNMSFLCVCVSLIANVTSGIYMGRMVVYFSIYNLILLPWLMHNSKIFEDRNMLKNGLYAFYIAYYIYSYCIYSRVSYQSEFLGLMVK